MRGFSNLNTYLTSKAPVLLIYNKIPSFPVFILCDLSTSELKKILGVKL